MDEAVRRAALDLLSAEQARDAARDEENALAWTLGVSYPPEQVSETLHGLYSDPVQALREAEQWQADLNQGNAPDEPSPFVVTVRPILNRES